MAKQKRQRVKHYRRSFYSKQQRAKKGVGLAVLVVAVLALAWLAAPHVLDWATHTWYTVVRDRDLSAPSQAASSEAASEPAPTPTPTPTATPAAEATLQPGTLIREGSWASVSLSALGSEDAARTAARSLREQGVDCALITLKDASGYIYYDSAVPSASGSIAAATVDPAAIAAAFRAEDVTPVAWLAAFRDPIVPYTDRSIGIHYSGGDYMWLDAANAAAGGKPWLNPYSDGAVQFVGDLIEELRGMGFEQVVLGNVQFPAAVSSKQDFGSTGGVSRAGRLAADIAAWQARFEGTVTLWYEYPLSSCQEADSTTGSALPPELGVENLVIRLPAEDAVADETVDALAQQMKELGTAYVAVRDSTGARLH